MIQINLFTKQKQTHRFENKLMVTKGERCGGGINYEFGINIYRLLYIKEITNKNLLCSTGNSTQYSVIAYMTKEYKKKKRREDICICITDNIVNQLYSNKI